MTLDLAHLRTLAEESRDANADGTRTLDIDLVHDRAMHFYQAASPTVVLELLDRLERAEKKLAERDTVYPTLMTQVGKEKLP